MTRIDRRRHAGRGRVAAAAALVAVAPTLAPSGATRGGHLRLRAERALPRGPHHVVLRARPGAAGGELPRGAQRIGRLDLHQQPRRGHAHGHQHRRHLHLQRARSAGEHGDHRGRRRPRPRLHRRAGRRRDRGLRQPAQRRGLPAERPRRRLRDAHPARDRRGQPEREPVRGHAGRSHLPAERPAGRRPRGLRHAGDLERAGRRRDGGRPHATARSSGQHGRPTT